MTLRAVRNAPPAPATSGVHEHEFEAARGLPEPLPPGERLLWQGAPDWRALARQALHLRLAGAYFSVLLLWRLASSMADGAGPGQALVGAVPLLLLALFACGTLAGLAWLMGRTTVYTITDRRVVMRIGIVLTVTFNLPYRRIDAAALRRRAGGTGDITLTLGGPDRIAWLHLWPHVRPWRIRQPQPMLRALPQAEAVAELLSQALAQAAGQARAAVPPAAAAPSKPTARPDAALAT